MRNLEINPISEVAMLSSFFYKVFIVLGLGMSLECFASECAAQEASREFSKACKVSSKRIDREDLIALVASSKNDVARQVARLLLNDCYETNSRPVVDVPGNKQFGSVFCVEPEVLAHLMTISRGKIVLEVGAAGGESALLMSLGGAKKVYINDISPLELKAPQYLASELGLAVEFLPGNCLEVFKESRFAGCFDVIYARNLFTFFLGEERERFVKEMLRVLKPGGCLFLTVNCALNGDELKRAHQASPDAYVFKKRTPIVMPHGVACIKEGSLSPELDLKGVDLTAHNVVPLMSFTAKGPQYSEEFKRFTPAAQKEFQEYVTGIIESNAKETIVCHITHMAAYTSETIRSVFLDKDWELVQSLLLGEKFHVTSPEGDISRLTVVLQKRPGIAQLETSVELPAQVNIAADTTCAHCGVSAAKIMRCTRCKKARYCSVDCQKAAWAKGHKSVCKPVDKG